MKVLLHALPLVALLAGCSKKDDPATDPFLGHWQSNTLRMISYEASGEVMSDVTVTVSSELDVTPTTLSVTNLRADGTKSTETDPYVRDGETITFTLPGGNAIETYYIRLLTPTSFTFERNGKSNSGHHSPYQHTIPYTR